MAKKRKSILRVEVPQQVRPWDRHPREGAQAWEAFVRYRDAGSSRSLRSTAADLGKSSQMIEEWSSQFSWVNRVRAYEQHLDAEAQRARVDELREMHRRLAQQHQVAAHLAIVSLTKRLRAEQASPDAPLLAARDATQLLAVASQFESRSREALAAIGSSGVDEAPPPNPALDLTKLTTEELRTLRALTQRARRD